MNKIILATIGPSSLNSKVLSRLSDIGVGLFRINLSHTLLEDLPKVITYIQSVSDVPICIDTEGAQIRTGRIQDNGVTVRQHEIIQACDNESFCDALTLCFYPDYAIQKLKTGDFISIDFHSVFAQIIDKKPESGLLTMRVLNGGSIGSNKAVTVNRDIDLPALTEKDKAAIKIAKEFNINHYALSFANRGEDIQLIRECAGQNSHIISKIECRNALKNISEIIDQSDAILIDRGDLSREVPLESLGMIQKQIIRTAKEKQAPVYIATNLLESMIYSPSPTRAEVNDIYTALDNGADGLVLAGETAIGRNPIRAASFISRMITFYENNFEKQEYYPLPKSTSTLPDVHGGGNLDNDFEEASDFKLLGDIKLVLGTRDLTDAEQMAMGTFSPLKGFMNQEDFYSVLDNNRLANGVLWSMPVVLQRPLSEKGKIKIGDSVILSDSNSYEHGVIDVDDIYEIDLSKTAIKWFGTSDENHPGVKRFLSKGELIIAGKVRFKNKLKSNFDSFLFRPRESRLIFQNLGWDRVVSFHTRNAPHRVHEYIQLKAMENTYSDGIYVSPMFGPKKSGDLLPEYVVKSYQILIEEGMYPENQMVLGGFHTYPRYCGPREALFTMICRKNMGCSHFIVGRDHSGVGKYYHSDDAREFIKSFNDELGIKAVFFEEIAFCTKKQKYLPKSEAINPLEVSGTQVRNLILKGKKIPPEIMRQSIQEMLRGALKNGKKIFYE